MFKSAIQSQLPLIAVQTRDVVNIAGIIDHLSRKDQAKCQPFTNAATISAKSIYYWFWNPAQDAAFNYVSLYEAFIEKESSLIIINPKNIVDPMFDAGVAPVPRKMLSDIFDEVLGDAVKDKATKLSLIMQALGGCTIREATEFGRLASATYGALTGEAIMKVRKDAFRGGDGLSLISVEDEYYAPPKDLQKHLKKEREFFLTGTDFRLLPRGILLGGPAGTGKTAAVRYIARDWKIPCYRLDIAATQNKYIGESERNLMNNLSRLDQEEPCVVLVDEIEKIFSSGKGDNLGVNSNMLSQILWWLAEKRSRVYVVMTTNNVAALPKELYRSGRIDAQFTLTGVTTVEAKVLVVHLLKRFKGVEATNQEIDHVVQDAKNATDSTVYGEHVSQALLTSKVHELVKTKLLSK